MLKSSQFIPGTILWLPKQNDIDDFYRLAPYNTVPDVCFGHSVLVLAEEKPTNCVIILILTSFGGGKKIHHRVRNRGHRLGDYVPIHPAPPLVERSLSLRLSASQEFAKQIWANILQPRRCPTAWLQATWPKIWKWNKRGRRIEPNSLHSLALYAMQRGYHPVVYGAMLERYTAPTISPCLQDNNAYTPATVAMSPNVPHNSFSFTRSEPNDRLRRIPSEFEPLLPLTHRTDGASGAGLRGRRFWAADSLVRLLKVLIYLGVTIGLLWIGYVVANWLVPDCKKAIESIVNASWGRIATIAVGA